MPYQVVTREGKPEPEVINGLKIKFPKATDYLDVVRGQLSAVGKSVKE
jgi:hypothetical protein